MACFGSKFPANQLDRLLKFVAGSSPADKMKASYLGLFMADLRDLPGAGLKLQLINDMFIPNRQVLKRKYGGKDTWLPLLYVRHIVTGLVRRFSLK